MWAVSDWRAPTRAIWIHTDRIPQARTVMRPGRGDWDGTMALDNGVPLWPVVVALLDGGPEEAQFARHEPRRHRWLVQVA